MGFSPKRVLQNSNFLTFKARHMKGWSKVNARERENLAKFKGPKIGFSPQTGLSKLELFNHSCWMHEIFSVSKYEKKIKFEKN